MKGSEEDRDAQFEYINAKSKLFMSEKEPVISVDCKKKELIGNYKNAGREWEKSSEPQKVNVYDYINKILGNNPVPSTRLINGCQIVPMLQNIISVGTFVC